MRTTGRISRNRMGLGSYLGAGVNIKQTRRDVLLRKRAIETAVQRVTPTIAQYKISAGGNCQLAIVNEVPIHRFAGSLHLGVGKSKSQKEGGGGEVVVSQRTHLNVRLYDRRAIQEQLSPAQMNTIARHSHHALRGNRRQSGRHFEDDHVTPLYRPHKRRLKSKDFVAIP